MNQQSIKTWVYITASIMSAFVIGFAIPSIYIGFRDDSSSCQDGTRAGLNLSDWLKGYGFEKVSVTVLVWLSIVSRTTPLLVVAVIFDYIFWFIWSIIGIVLLATNENNDCVGDDTDLGDMAIVALCSSFFSLFFIFITLK